jgi:hypothetical protein
VIAHILATIQNYPPAFEIKRYGLLNELAVTSAYRRIGIGSIYLIWLKTGLLKRK